MSKDELLEAGITEAKAETLVEAGYDTPEKVAEASLEDLMELSGIGEATAEKIQDAVAGDSTQPTIRPDLDAETLRALEIREAKSDARPTFTRQNAFRYVRVGGEWRRPRGIHSRQREGKAYRASRPGIGQRGPKAARGLHPSGFEEVLVHRPDDLEGIDPSTEAARIGSTVGGKKRAKILDKADELGIRVLNRGGGG